jgi:hypothetical protein
MAAYYLSDPGFCLARRSRLFDDSDVAVRATPAAASGFSAGGDRSTSAE